MDKIFNYIINSTHSDALIILVEKLFNGTKYFELFECLKKDIIYPYKNQIIGLIYNVVKAGDNSTKLVKVFKNFWKENINGNFINDLKRKFKEPNVKKALRNFRFNNKVINIMKEELLENDNIIDGFFVVINNTQIIEIISGIIENGNSENYILDAIPKIFQIIRDKNKGYIKLLLIVSERILKQLLLLIMLIKPLQRK